MLVFLTVQSKTFFCSIIKCIVHHVSWHWALILLLFTPNSRVGQRGAGLSATIARSEHEISEIIDGLSEQEVRLLAMLCYLTMQRKGLFQRVCFAFLLEEKHFGVLVWESLCKLWLKTNLRNTFLLRIVFPNCTHPRPTHCPFQTCHNLFVFTAVWDVKSHPF